MPLKVVQLNIYKGKWLKEVVGFLQKEKPDIITMQEVSAGEVNFFEDQGANLFEILKSDLGLFGVFNSEIRLLDAPKSQFGNAVFSRFKILESKVVTLSTFRPLTLDEFNNNIDDVWSSVPRHMLDAVLEVEGVDVHAISVHGRRTPRPVDNEESTRQSQVMVDHIKSLGDTPFIIGGDFNMTPETKVIKNVAAVSHNLLEEKDVKQTLNPRRHFLKDNGFVVDYIFASKGFNVADLYVPDVDVSDHLPVVAKLEFVKNWTFGKI